MNETPVLAVIGGTGLYEFEDITDIETLEISTPYGDPSSPIIIGRLKGKKVAFLARHGIGHTFSPSDVPYRANIYALKSLGIKRVVSVSACGSLREAYAPGHIVIPDQIFDFTHKRDRSFFGKGLVAHISVADPFCKSLSDILEEAVKTHNAPYHRGGTYITIEGPRFSTKGESRLYRQWGLDIIGMTASPEVFLAREAEMCYTTMAHVTDYDVWHANEAPVTVEMLIKTLTKNVKVAQDTIRTMVDLIDPESSCECENALGSALTTDPKAIDPKKREEVDLLVRKYLE